jgi:glycosyltransferase involved in cell wall biosynthesis
MKIAIDIRRISEFGVGTYIWNLVRNLAVIDSTNEYVLIGSARNFHELGPLAANFTQLYRPSQSTFWRDHCGLSWILRRNRVDVFHMPHHEGLLIRPAKTVVTVHDCVHLLFPAEEATNFQKYRNYLRTKRVVENAVHLLAVSESTKEDLVNILNVDESKVSVVYNGLDERFAQDSPDHCSDEERHPVLDRYQLQDPFILYSGKIRPHKNLQRLIEAFAVLKGELAENDRYRNLKLIIIGDELSRHQYLRLAVVRSGVQHDVRFFGFVPYPILRVFYQSAAAFAFPSLYEGFGLPPLEAMASGTPVLASNTSSLPEVLEDAALLVNPENVFEIARGLKLILTDDVLRRRLIDRGLQQVQKFSWRVAAERVIETYRRTASLPVTESARAQSRSATL